METAERCEDTARREGPASAAGRKIGDSALSVVMALVFLTKGMDEEGLSWLPGVLASWLVRIASLALPGLVGRAPVHFPYGAKRGPTGNCGRASPVAPVARALSFCPTNLYP